MIQYLSLADFAKKTDLSVNTLKGYRKKGLLPKEDARIGAHPGWHGWLEETVDRWTAMRGKDNRQAELI